MVYDDFLPFFPETSGNDVNGLGEKDIRRPSPFFWHPPDQHAYGELQREVIGIQRRSPDITAHYSHKAPRGPAPIEKAGIKIEKSAQDWTEAVKTFALAHEGDLVGIARMDPLYVYEGYELTHPWVVIVGVTWNIPNLIICRHLLKIRATLLKWHVSIIEPPGHAGS